MGSSDISHLVRAVIFRLRIEIAVDLDRKIPVQKVFLRPSGLG
jgi:hypothetical protein